jgi:predicted transcriptional regulator
MEAPCQKIVWNILPAIKAAIAAELVRNGVTQVEASRMLDMAPSAVSQYISGKRGYRIEFGDDVKLSIQMLVRDLMDNKDVDLVQRTCAICRQLRGDDEGCAAYSAECSPRKRTTEH